MPLPPADTKEFIDRMSALADDCRAELEANSQALQEIALLINQTTSEVDRLSQRELQVANRVREMDANIESYARADIRDFLRTAHETELRLHIMRGQLEQLQEREQSIRAYQERLRSVVDVADAYVKTADEQTGTGRLRTRGLRRSAGPATATIPLGDIIQAQEDERLRLARQVTDGPAQILANVILQAEICERLMERDPDQARAELGELRKSAARGLVDARRMLYELRPVALNELSVAAALRRYAAEIARQRALEVNVIGPETDEGVPEPARLSLYRLLMEAIGAASRDDGITRVDVDLRYEEAQVIGRLEAQGEAVDRSQSLARFRADETVQRRLDQLGAELQHETAGEHTARMTIVIPLV